MAKDTPLSYRNLVIYEVYVRNHGPHGTFADVEADLERIRSIGVDFIWFMPIHPIGKIARKGSQGSPYSIVDYREVNPEYGSKADFARLIEKAHSIGLKVMIDVVYNHTAHDSILVREHPEWFHQDEMGKPVTTVPDWSDVIDLKYPNEDLATYLVDSLQMWAQFGVDGFRCDVASLLPESFWTRARAEVASIKPGVVWLAESVHAGFVAYRRIHGLNTLSDSEVYQGFDLTYDYDIWPIWQAAVTGKVPVTQYLEMVRFQDSIYPGNYVKMRCVENHDQARIMRLASTPEQALAWTAFEAFNKGAFLIYGGQEAGAVHTPSLFEIDRINWNGYPFQDYFTILMKIKKDPIIANGIFTLLSGEPAITAAWDLSGEGLYGVFNTQKISGEITIHLADGTYSDVLSGNIINVQRGRITLPESAVILRYNQEIPLQPFFSNLLDTNISAS